MVRKYEARLEICLMNGTLEDRADAEGREDRVSWAAHGRSTGGSRGGSNCRRLLHCLSVCDARLLLFLLQVTVKVFESGRTTFSLWADPDCRGRC